MGDPDERTVQPFYVYETSNGGDTYWAYTDALNNACTVTCVPSGASPPGTTVPPTTQIVDASGAIWTLSTIAASGGFEIFRNGTWIGGGSAVKLTWNGTQILALSKSGLTYMWNGTSWVKQ